jgi:hypothetical protein
VGHVGGALIIGAIAGVFLPNPLMVLVGAASLGAAAAISSVVCWWWPGFDTAGWKLWPVAVLASPLMLLALGFLLYDWECVVGTRRGWDCIGAALAIVVTGTCLLPPFGGLIWRWWKRRGA